MASFLCFICHSTVSCDTSEDIREKYRDIVGMHLCPDSHLCYVCCQVLHKLSLFKAYCLKRSLEYPVLFSEKGTIYLQRSDIDYVNVCTEQNCLQSHYRYTNTKTYIFKHESFNQGKAQVDDSSNQYVDLQKDRNMHQEDYEPNFDELNLWHNDDLLCQNNDLNNDDTITNNDDTTLNHDDIINDSNFTTNDVNYTNSETNEQYPVRAENDEANMGYDSNDDVNDFNDDIDNFNVNNDFNDDNYENNTTQEISSQEIHNTISDNLEETNLTDVTSKPKKVKKKSFEKIVLSVKEQRAVLEEQRKEKKYLEAQFKCHSCALGFIFKDTYQSHMVRHEESNGQFSCAICKLRFATQNARCMHVILHSEIYRCNKCGIELKRPHRKRHSIQCWGAAEPRACALCGKSFRDANCLQQHVKRFHEAKTNKRIYSCNICGKTYTEQNAVRTHMLTHVNRRFNCDKCPSTFTSPYTLNQHLKVHEQTRVHALYHCHSCDRSFDNKKSLMAHFRRTALHQGQSLQCPLCHRKLSSSRSLAAHVASHSHKTHFCVTCGTAHASRDALMRHVRRHGEGKAKDVVCHLCGNTYKGQNKLNRHLKEVCGRAQLEEQLASYYTQNEQSIQDIQL